MLSGHCMQWLPLQRDSFAFVCHIMMLSLRHLTSVCMMNPASMMPRAAAADMGTAASVLSKATKLACC